MIGHYHQPLWRHLRRGSRAKKRATVTESTTPMLFHHGQVDANERAATYDSETRDDLDVSIDGLSRNKKKERKNRKKKGTTAWVAQLDVEDNYLISYLRQWGNGGKVLSWAGRVTRPAYTLSLLLLSVNLVKYFSVLVSLFSRASEPFNYRHRQPMRGEAERKFYDRSCNAGCPSVLSCVRYSV